MTYFQYIGADITGYLLFGKGFGIACEKKCGIAVYYFLLFLAGILLYFRIKKESVGKEDERKAEKTNGETVAAQDADNGRSEKKRYVFISS